MFWQREYITKVKERGEKKMARIMIFFCLIACLLAGCTPSNEEMERRDAEAVKAIRQERINAERALARERSAIEREQKRIKLIEDDKKLGYIIWTVIDESSLSGYCLGIKTDSGRTIGLHVIDSEDKKATALSLDMITEKGSRISFPAGNLKSADSLPAQYYAEETCFEEGVQTGTKMADRIRVLENNNGGE